MCRNSDIAMICGHSYLVLLLFAAPIRTLVFASCIDRKRECSRSCTRLRMRRGNVTIQGPKNGVSVLSSLCGFLIVKSQS